MRWFIVVSGLACAGCQFIPGTEANMERVALSKLEPLLIDATDARFRDLHTISVSGENAICGYVNSKNRMGGYAGYTRFLAGTNNSFVAVDPQAGEYASDSQTAEQAGFDAVWKDCERTSEGGVVAKQSPADAETDNLAAMADRMEALANRTK